MDSRIRQIASSNAAGQFFIVTDASQVPALEAEPKMRLVFINTESGPVNALYTFALGDTASLYSTFGKQTRKMTKQGNFSIKTCEDMLSAGPISVVNLRSFDNTIDLAGICSLNPNVNVGEKKTVAYTKLFDTNGFWIPKAKQLPSYFTEESLLNFGNVGKRNLSIMTVKSPIESVNKVTSEGSNKIKDTILKIADFPGIDDELTVADTFVDVYVFANTFTATATANKYYGHLFDNNGTIKLSDLPKLAAIPESGFVRKHTGSMVPYLKSETDAALSIDTVIYTKFASDGLLCYINDNVLESTTSILDISAAGYYDEDGLLESTNNKLLSHIVPEELSTVATVYPLVAKTDDVAPIYAHLQSFNCETIATNQFITSFNQGLRVGDRLIGVDGPAIITSLVVVNEAAVIGATTDTFRKVLYTTDAAVFATVTEGAFSSVVRQNLVVFDGDQKVQPSNCQAYIARVAQFTNGSASKQSEILDMMLNPGVVKGITTTKSVRYIVDAFKSFVENGYKHQYGMLTDILDGKNKIVRTILNDVFVSDLANSLDPLFKTDPESTFDASHLLTGGNPAYTTRFLGKFATGESLCFSFGPGEEVEGSYLPLAGKASNLFYKKRIAYDPLANETGYLDGIDALEYIIDDTERFFFEKFRYNCVIPQNGSFTIYGNFTNQLKASKQQQITNSELLADIKINILAIIRPENFKKGTYQSYLATETEIKSLMDGYVTGGAIQPNPVVICSEENNTTEIANLKIKLVTVEYVATNTLDKVVVSLKIE